MEGERRAHIYITRLCTCMCAPCWCVRFGQNSINRDQPTHIYYKTINSYHQRLIMSYNRHALHTAHQTLTWMLIGMMTLMMTFDTVYKMNCTQRIQFGCENPGQTLNNNNIIKTFTHTHQGQGENKRRSGVAFCFVLLNFVFIVIYFVCLFFALISSKTAFLL